MMSLEKLTLQNKKGHLNRWFSFVNKNNYSPFCASIAYLINSFNNIIASIY
ncbi:hypothetical protein AWRIB429_2132 [Oenococcus oeni AWRIB429]|uniref:Uncharacterized protein n=1 Tax=Oenococcus oeni AWRIB429 TaxID=655225 RepID=D3LCQ2_OENOE|nr:hypothetical protein AWRIB429_2132 [Oenococcus oeni AWRIB429]